MIPSRHVSLRLGDLGEKFEALEAEFPGIPTPTLLRLLLAVTLNRPVDEQVKAIQSEITRKPLRRGDQTSQS